MISLRKIIPAPRRGLVVSTVAERKTPEGKNSAKHSPPDGLVLRCIVFQSKPREFTAECIDLDLMVRGQSTHDALGSLRDAINGYLAVACEGDIAGLVPRPAPLSHRLRYNLFALRAAFSIRIHGAQRSFLLSDCTPRTVVSLKM